MASEGVASFQAFFLRSQIMRPALIAAATVMFAIVSTAHGETVRCGSSLVDESTTVDELLRKCGEPTSRRQEEQDVRVRSGSGTRSVGATVIQFWTYDRGTQAAPMLVTIADGKIRAIELLR
jgi:hypothetical protein